LQIDQDQAPLGASRRRLGLELQLACFTVGVECGSKDELGRVFR